MSSRSWRVGSTFTTARPIAAPPLPQAALAISPRASTQPVRMSVVVAKALSYLMVGGGPQGTPSIASIFAFVARPP